MSDILPMGSMDAANADKTYFHDVWHFVEEKENYNVQTMWSFRSGSAFRTQCIAREQPHESPVYAEPSEQAYLGIGVETVCQRSSDLQGIKNHY